MRFTLESGDVFVLLPMVARKGSPYKTKIQIIEADRVSNPDNEADSETLSGGIERDQYGAPVKYHIMDGHPGDLLSMHNFTWTPVQDSPEHARFNRTKKDPDRESCSGGRGNVSFGVVAFGRHQFVRT